MLFLKTYGHIVIYVLITHYFYNSPLTEIEDWF